MKYWRHLLICALAITFSGCGTTVKESLKIPSTERLFVGEGKTAVILPFADYSYFENIESAYRRNLFINENIADYLVKDGFQVPVQDDVNLFLATQNIINLRSTRKQHTSSLEAELNSEWSPGMKRILRGYLNASRKNIMDDPGAKANETNGLTGQEIVKIGRHFSADYIVRGRIIQFTDRQNASWEPWKRGVIPFVFGVNKQLFFGQTSADGYDGLGPYEANKGGDVVIGQIPQAVVQVRIWVQDAYTGSVVWTNRSDVKVSPATFWSDYQADNLFETAVEEAITSLLDDFAYTVFGVPLPVKTPEPVQ